MNIIIGSEGFLGSYLCKTLKYIIKIKLSNYDKFIERLVENNNIFICADVKNNTIIINDLIKMNKNNTYILFSSAAIYYNIDKKIYSENDIDLKNIHQ